MSDRNPVSSGFALNEDLQDLQKLQDQILTQCANTDIYRF